MILFKISKKGFTLIELVMVIILVGIMATVSVSVMTGNVDAQRYENTLKKMEFLRDAIVGTEVVDELEEELILVMEGIGEHFPLF